jgi:hypothetical protein
LKDTIFVKYYLSIEAEEKRREGCKTVLNAAFVAPACPINSTNNLTRNLPY